MVNRFDVQWFLEEEGKGGGGGNDDDKARRNLQSLLEKRNGDAVALAADLLSENHGLREKNRELRVKVTPDGAVVLNADEAKHWESFSKLGTPEAVTKQLNDSKNAVAERDELKAEKVIVRAAELSGYKSDVLIDLAKSKGFTIEIDGDGDAAKVNAKWRNGEKDEVQLLSEYAETVLSPYLPSLQTQSASAISAVPMGTRVVPQRTGAAVPMQPISAIDAKLQQREASRLSRPNPLMAPIAMIPDPHGFSSDGMAAQGVAQGAVGAKK